MLRRQARERRQYIYAKSLEAQERQTYERKQQIKDALAQGKALPTELRKSAKELTNDLAFDEAQTGTQPAFVVTINTRDLCYRLLDPASHIDNEYSRAGIMDPKIIVTTSRDPSSKLLQFAKVHRVAIVHFLSH